MVSSGFVRTLDMEARRPKVPAPPASGVCALPESVPQNRFPLVKPPSVLLALIWIRSLDPSGVLAPPFLLAIS